MEKPSAPGSETANGKRASRACLSCRVRKQRCDLDSEGIPGRPPCRRCFRERLECVLATSRRGGKRVRKSVSNSTTTTSGMIVPQDSSVRDGAQPVESKVAGAAENDLGWHNSPKVKHPSNSPDRGDWNNQSWDRASIEESVSTPSETMQNPSTIANHIASSDLLNPSDALDLLAQVASTNDEERAKNSKPLGQNVVAPRESSPRNPEESETCYFPPIANRLLSQAGALHLIRLYHEKYHPYFPVAYRSIFEESNITELIKKEPHLFTAVLTVASKNEPSWSEVHAACSTHMERLISKLIYKGSSSVGSVEALLILAEWAPQQIQSKPTIGRGEEDQGAWMQVGCAIRLGYLQELEQTGLQLSSDRSELADRKRLAWTACYMSDRQVSIRLGKGFWSRGPGPSIALHAADFPSLQTSQQPGLNDLSVLFQAHVELTQLFSNAHDILYSSTSHREHLYSEGEYVRYIDDFTSMLRKWKLVWGTLSFTPHVKATLVLSYDFLRLYINAFAFQATINRAVARARQKSSTSTATGPLFSNVAGHPDARFIYESIDAANSLLSTLNSFIDPATGLRYMPLKYYLYVIYAAVFLFKARSAGALANETHTSVRRAINVTIDRLQKSSVNPHSPGHRYARLLHLLWRKPRQTNNRNKDSADPGSRSGTTGPEKNLMEMSYDIAMDMDPLGGFSWRDLDAVGEFITNETSITDSMLASPPVDGDQSNYGNLDVLANDWYEDSWEANNVVF